MLTRAEVLVFTQAPIHATFCAGLDADCMYPFDTSPSQATPLIPSIQPLAEQFEHIYVKYP